MDVTTALLAIVSVLVALFGAILGMLFQIQRDQNRRLHTLEEWMAVQKDRDRRGPSK